jgi:regulation of enolase protein 1 (concanavalin A-like superfamily)
MHGLAPKVPIPRSVHKKKPLTCRLVAAVLLSLFTTVASEQHPQAAVSGAWTTADVGSPALAGVAQDTPCSAATGCPAFSIAGGGAGVAGAADQFTLLHQRLTADGMVTLRVLSLTGTTTAEVGLMLRESLSASSRHVSILASANSVTVRSRSTMGGATASLVVARTAWLRLERVGPVITASVSNDGAQWTIVAAQTMALPSTVYAGIAVTSRSPTGLATAIVSGMAVTPNAPTMPTGWSSVDVGPAPSAGTASYSGSTFVGASYGTGLAGSADGFRLIYTRVRGDAKLVARVAASQGTFGRQAGIVLRSTLDAGAVEAALMSEATGVVLVKRTGAGQSVSKTRVASNLTPVYLQLDRKGSTITPSYSIDGSRWTAIPGFSVAFGAELYAGLAVAAGTGGAAAAAFDRLSLVSVAANAAPVVSLTSPSAGQQFTVSQPVQIAASASDPDDLIARVDFHVNNVRIATDTAAPYIASWTPSSAGSYSLTAVAVDSDGETTTSTAVVVSARSASTNSPPLVSLTSPAGGQKFSIWQQVNFAASASDMDDKVVRVDFHINNVRIASDSTAPYTANWTAVALGNYSLTAVAVDADGATTTSTPVAISVLTSSSSSTTPPPSTSTPPPSTSTPPPPSTGTGWRLQFDPSLDHDLIVGYTMEISLRLPLSITLSVSKSIGKPPIGEDGTCVLDVDAIVAALPVGTYQVVVKAVGHTGTTPSVPMVFAR